MPSIRKGENREQFLTRVRAYMNARNHPGLPVPHSVTRPSRPHLEPISAEARAKRDDFVNEWRFRDGKWVRANMYPERVIGRDSRDELPAAIN